VCVCTLTNLLSCCAPLSYSMSPEIICPIWGVWFPSDVDKWDVSLTDCRRWQVGC
jgi:hypothetical protein